jgi:hypothetical protein
MSTASQNDVEAAVNYVPENFRKKSAKWIPKDQRGTIIQFPLTVEKSA